MNNNNNVNNNVETTEAKRKYLVLDKTPPILVERMIYLRTKKLRASGRNVAKMLDMPHQTYTLIEAGKRNCSIELLIKLHKLYNVSVDYLLGLDNNMTNNKNVTVDVEDDVVVNKISSIDDYKDEVRNDLIMLIKQIDSFDDLEEIMLRVERILNRNYRKEFKDKEKM